MSIPELERLLQRVAYYYPTASEKEVEASWQKIIDRLDKLAAHPATALCPGYGVDRPDFYDRLGLPTEQRN